MWHWALGLMLLIVGCASVDRDGLELQQRAVDAVLDGFHTAASRADFEAYFSVWEPDSLFLGTDATERWVGEEFKAFARTYFKKGKGWTYVPRQRRWTRIDLNVMQFDELLENEKLGTCRGSGVLVHREGGWKIVQYNLSIPVPNAIAEKVAGEIRALGPAK
jgi:SnoaL-like domain